MYPQIKTTALLTESIPRTDRPAVLGPRDSSPMGINWSVTHHRDNDVARGCFGESPAYQSEMRLPEKTAFNCLTVYI